MPTVTFLPTYRKIEVEYGATILDAAQRAGLAMNVVCGGLGKCGKCLVYVKSGKATYDRESLPRFFTAEEIARGACLACKSQVSGDLHVIVPESSLIQEQKILIESSESKIEFRPSIRKYFVTCEPPSLNDPSTDLSRLLRAIQKKGGPVAEKIYAPLEILRQIPSLLRESNWTVTATIAIVPGGYRLINLEPGDTTKRLYGAAVDLGSTTIVAYLCDLTNGTTVAVSSNYNRQISCGEDILARVNYAKKNGVGKLQLLAAESINAALRGAANSAGVDLDDVYEVVLSGNTVMTHILLGIDPGYIIAEPYVPVVRRSLSVIASRIGVTVAKTAGLFSFPSVSDFIGGDIIADIIACGMGDRDEITLMIDIGTNFEVVLGNKEWMFSCAGAAGPALEGGEVLFGMRANPGAIERISIDEATLEPKFETINHIRPRGICGSGLIDLLAELLKACIIDRNGHINRAITHPRIRQGSHFMEYVVAWKDETDIGKDIVLTENDIKNLIMSKSSILAACFTLMNVADIGRDEISEIYFAGGFGNYVNKEHAILIGLIPEIPVEHIKNIGNGAVTGAHIALLNRPARKMLDQIAEKIGYVELNAENSFMDEYTSSCFLPHTDLTLFPRVEKILNECRIRRI